MADELFSRELVNTDTARQAHNVVLNSGTESELGADRQKVTSGHLNIKKRWNIKSMQVNKITINVEYSKF